MRGPIPPTRPDEPPGALDVFRNRPFLLLWLSQLFTQIGGNMVLFGLTVIVVELDELDDRQQPPDPLVPGAGRGLLGRRRRLRGPVRQAVRPGRHERAAGRAVRRPVGRWGEPPAPAPVQRPHLHGDRLLRPGGGGHDPAGRAAQAAPLGQRRLHAHPQRGVRDRLRPAGAARRQRCSGPPALILVVGACYLVAAGFCWTLPPSPPVDRDSASESDGRLDR